MYSKYVNHQDGGGIVNYGIDKQDEYFRTKRHMRLMRRPDANLTKKYLGLLRL
jgi:hypothetical protein